jgi:hypothetical protein
MSYAPFGQTADTACRLSDDPAGWIPSAGAGGCLAFWVATDPTASARCAELLQQIYTSASQPYWGLPVPTPYEAELFNWMLNYGYVRQTKAGACRLRAADGDILVYNPQQWAGWLNQSCALAGAVSPELAQQCNMVSAEMASAQLPFSQWLQQAASRGDGVVLAGRPVRTDIMSGQQTWDINAAEFFAPSSGDILPMLSGILPPEAQAAAKVFLTASKAIMLARDGKLGAARELFVVYAPALSNLGIPISGLGQWTGVTVPIPTIPGLQISYPDGKGGVVTIGTTVTPDPSSPPAGATPLKQPGEPPEKLSKWVEFIGAGLAAIVAAGGIYAMWRGSRRTAS